MLSFAITAYRETTTGRKHGHQILECIQSALEHPSIDEIVVVDDASSDYDELVKFLEGTPKLRLFCNETNLAVFGNKLEAVYRSRGEWVITCDSDNRMDTRFVNKILGEDKRTNMWYCPSFARPSFDYRKLICEYSLKTIGDVLDKPMIGCCLNTGNQTVHRESFLKVFEKYRGQRFDLMMPNWLKLNKQQQRSEHYRQVWNAADSFIYNMEWLSAGNLIHIMAGLEYAHYVGTGMESNYLRAGPEKTKLTNILMAELRRRSKVG